MIENTKIDQLKAQFNILAERFENLINDFHQMLNHREIYLEDHIFEIKNKIDIQREELINDINKASNRMISILDKYHSECLSNLSSIKSNVTPNTLKMLKADLNEKKDIVVSSNEVGIHKIESLINEIRNKLHANQIEMESYENQLKQNINYSFEPVKFDSFQQYFGQLVDNNDNSIIKSCKMNVRIEKSFNTPFNEKLTNLLDIIDDYKLAVKTNKNQILILNIHTSSLIDRIKDKDYTNCLKWISKSKLATASLDNMINIWDLDDDIRKSPTTLAGHSKNIRDLCYDQERNHLISFSHDASIKIWNLDNFECVQTLITEKINSNSIYFSINPNIQSIKINPDGFLMSLNQKENLVKVWNPNHDYKCELNIKRKKIHLIELTPDGNLVCVTRNYIEIFDFVTGECIRRIDYLNEYYEADDNIDYEEEDDDDDECWIHQYSDHIDDISVKFLKFISKSMFIVVFEDYAKVNGKSTRIKLFDINQEKCIYTCPTIMGLEKTGSVCMLNNKDLVFLCDSKNLSRNDEPDYFNSDIKIVRFT